MLNLRWTVKPLLEELHARWTPAVVSGAMPALAVDAAPALVKENTAPQENSSNAVEIVEADGIPSLTDGEFNSEEQSPFSDAGEGTSELVYTLDQQGDSLDSEFQVTDFNTGEVPFTPIFYSMRGGIEEQNPAALDSLQQEPASDQIFYTMAPAGYSANSVQPVEHTSVILAHALLSTPEATVSLNPVSPPLLVPQTAEQVAAESKPVEATVSPATETAHTTQQTLAESVIPTLNSIADARLHFTL